MGNLNAKKDVYFFSAVIKYFSKFIVPVIILGMPLLYLTSCGSSVNPGSPATTAPVMSPSPHPSGSTWYVSPTGSDSNPGTLSSPFKSITKAQTVAFSGDLVYLRGGTYNAFTIAGSDSNYNFVHNIVKSGIIYEAYPGETPVFDFSNITTEKRVAAFHIASGVTDVTFIGLTVTGVPVGSQKQSECFRVEGNAEFVRVTCRDNAANGFYFTNKGSGSCTNCDAYNNRGTGESLGNTDGFGAHSTGSIIFTGCRAWNNSDDGFDCIASTASNTFDHCWAFNMKAGGDSNGFKIGGWGTATPPASVPVHVVTYCLAANNASHGFYANHHPGQAAIWTSNTAYNNSRSNFNMLERVSPTDPTDIAGTREVMHYNLAYNGTNIENANLAAGNVTDNSWNKSGVSVAVDDFVSTDVSQLTRPRAADGSLPTITFMYLTSGSDLKGLGCFPD
ncbi:MAG TPA: right-handed parallel beta-helix repeat-containing protein [Bacillota bacterium]|nr:right-handed parallel beta-helix repeat-containing protein [Bacillota bacterium]